MIKLIDILKEIEQEQQVEEGKVGNIITGLGLTAVTMLGGAKAQDKVPTNKPTVTATKKAPTGTTIDGILGQFTSQFKFPHAELEDLDAGTIENLGVEGNAALLKIRKFSTGKMKQWNAFVDWMKTAKINGEKISGNPILDTDSTLGTQVIDAYRKTPQGKNFWVKTGDDIEEVQEIIKAYRKYTVADWKLGDGTADGGHSMIGRAGEYKNPKDPKDVKWVEDNYMKWAKD